MIFSFIKRFISVVLTLIVAAFSGTVTPERRCEPVFTGTFLQSWLACQWDDEQWENEIAEMKKDGIKYLILQSVADKSSATAGGKWTTYYDADIPEFSDADKGANVVEATLKACKGTGIQVFMGLCVFDDFWYIGGFGSQYKECCEVSAALVKDIYARYGEEYADTLAGFYFTPEFSNIIMDSASAIQLSNGLNTVIDAMNTSCPELPLMLSPFSTNYLTLGTVDAAAFWSRIITRTSFRDGDIIAPQDAVGAAFSEVDDLEKNWQMFRSLVDSADVDIKLWANCESFTLAREKTIISGIALPNATENTTSVPVTMDRFSYQLDVASRYCDNIITFSYNHYLSENQVDSRFVEAYRTYIENGYEVEKNAPSKVPDFSAVQGDGVALTWESATDDAGIAYYRITKNGDFLVRIECMYGEPELSYIDSNGKAGDKYAITAYDTSGNASQTVEAVA